MVLVNPCKFWVLWLLRIQHHWVVKPSFAWPFSLGNAFIFATFRAFFSTSFLFLGDLKSARMLIDWICPGFILQSLERTSFTMSIDLLWISFAVHVWLPQWYTYTSLSLEKAIYFRAEHDWWFPEAEQYSQVSLIVKFVRFEYLNCLKNKHSVLGHV